MTRMLTIVECMFKKLHIFYVMLSSLYDENVNKGRAYMQKLQQFYTLFSSLYDENSNNWGVHVKKNKHIFFTYSQQLLAFSSYNKENIT